MLPSSPDVKEKLPVIVKSHSSHLIKKGKGIDPVLQQNKAVNIDIAGSTMNGMVVHPGETFSFCNTVGKATTAKGYQEADIYVNGKKKKGLGGGNCQVSTTLYNAVLKVTGLEVVERHQHSNHVPYIQDGKDAAVAYGSYDFKFKNNTEKTIKIVMENTTQNVTAKIYS